MRAPVLAIAGGAGAMGSLFAELLLPATAGCLLVDCFPTSTDGTDDRAVPLWPLVERLNTALGRQGLEGKLVGLTQGSDSAYDVAVGRVVRSAPAWMLVYRRGEAPPSPELPAKHLELAEMFEFWRRQAGVERVVGLLSPSQAGEAARLSDILLVATPFVGGADFAAVLAPYAAALRSGSLVADLLSIKEAPADVLRQVFAPEVGLIGTHPLFGRTVGDVTGLVVAVVPAADGRPVVPWQHWLLRQFAALGMLITSTTAAEHDSAMGYVQALTHFALLCFAYTFVRANQDPTQLLPYRTPVFEPLLYLAARVASLAQRSPEVYGAIQTECAHPELRRLFVETAQELLAAIEGAGDELATGMRGPGDEEKHARPPDRLVGLFQTLGAPWTPAYHRDAESFEQLLSMSGALTEPINTLRHDLLRSAGQVRGIHNSRTGAVTLGAVYVDPYHHDRVDLASRLRYHRFILSTGELEGANLGAPADPADRAHRRRTEAALSSMPLAQVRLLTEDELLRWLNAHTGPRTGPDDHRGSEAGQHGAHRLSERSRYAGKAHFDLSLALPDWFDDDCLQRLLVGRRVNEGVIAVAVLAPQDSSGLAVPRGHQVATVRLASLLSPKDVLDLRVSADRQVRLEMPGTGRGMQRRQADRRFAAAIVQRQLLIRQGALDWLLGHGCDEVRPQPMAG